MSGDDLYYTTEGATYAYEISGQGIPIVLLHGFTGSRSTWSSFVSKWKTEFQIITIDLPGHADTTVKTPRTIEACCNDLVNLFNHLGLTQFHLVGYSMGGRVALSLAMLYPNYILSLILESASPGINSEEERKARMKNDEKLAQKLEEEGIISFVNSWENIPLFATQKNMPIHLQQAIRSERLTQSIEGLAQSLRFMGTGIQPSWWAKLVHFTNPVLLIVGEVDEKFVTINKQMKRSFLNADLVVVENAGHAIHVEQSEKFGKLVVGFIKHVKNT